MSPLRQRGGSHLQHLDVEDEGLRVLLQGVQVRMTQGAMLMHLSNSTAMPLALQGVLALSDVAEALGHQRIQDCVLQGGGRGTVSVRRCSLGTRESQHHHPHRENQEAVLPLLGFFLPSFPFSLLSFLILFILFFFLWGRRVGFKTEFLHVSLTILELTL